MPEGNCPMLSADGRVTVKASGVELWRASPDGFVEVALAARRRPHGPLARGKALHAIGLAERAPR